MRWEADVGGLGDYFSLSEVEFCGMFAFFFSACVDTGQTKFLFYYS